MLSWQVALLSFWPCVVFLTQLHPVRSSMKLLIIYCKVYFSQRSLCDWFEPVEQNCEVVKRFLVGTFYSHKVVSCSVTWGREQCVSESWSSCTFVLMRRRNLPWDAQQLGICIKRVWMFPPCVFFWRYVQRLLYYFWRVDSAVGNKDRKGPGYGWMLGFNNLHKSR